jgi:hypothetical protein
VIGNAIMIATGEIDEGALPVGHLRACSP